MEIGQNSLKYSKFQDFEMIQLTREQVRTVLETGRTFCKPGVYI